MKRLVLFVGLICFQFLMKAPYINYYFVPPKKLPTAFQEAAANPIKISDYKRMGVLTGIITLHSGQHSAYERVHKNGASYYGSPTTCATDENGRRLGTPAQIAVHVFIPGLGPTVVMRDVCQIS